MTVLEKLDRMESCAHCIAYDCELGYRAPAECGDCNEYVGVLHGGKAAGGADMSDVQIYIPADKVWVFYLQNSERCKREMVLIAENTGTRYAVYITEENDLLMFSVCKGDKKAECEEYAINEDDCKETAKKLFFRYLVPITVTDEWVSQPESSPDEPDDDSLSLQDMEDEMYEREDELDLAVKDFLAVVFQEQDMELLVAQYGQCFFGAVLDDFLTLLTKDYSCEVYRPMFVTDEETGCEVYTEFPYEEEAGEGDDECNV